MYEYRKNLSSGIPSGIVSIGGVIRFFMEEPAYIRNRFAEALIQLKIGDLSYIEKQDLAHKILNEYFDMVAPGY